MKPDAASQYAPESSRTSSAASTNLRPSSPSLPASIAAFRESISILFPNPAIRPACPESSPTTPDICSTAGRMMSVGDRKLSACPIISRKSSCCPAIRPAALSQPEAVRSASFSSSRDCFFKSRVASCCLFAKSAASATAPLPFSDSAASFSRPASICLQPAKASSQAFFILSSTCARPREYFSAMSLR